MTTLRRRNLLLAGATWALAPAATHAQPTFDQAHSAWSVLLKKHVVLLRGGQASQLRYAGMQTDRAALQRCLDLLSAVPRTAFDGFTKPQQQAFLINAYNAFTVELVLMKYPALKSIRDLGGWLSNPWKPKWIRLLGSQVSLDDIEHAMLRQRGVFDDPRVHFAVNCASIGCPMLREEAFTAERLEQQLEEQTERFMADRSRNRWNAQGQVLELSKIFDWYGEDFRLGHRGIDSLQAFMAHHAERLADAPADQQRLRSRSVNITYLEYDWALNDHRSMA